ncbi:response regulator [Paenibacillus agaridevorans]|uniref:response regulator n=1 Tax=Paenibacillus agaridevorans TaxID=171404 RepID=UPI0024849C70|nr:response regulator [Paenibacillus agaridevorans]
MYRLLIVDDEELIVHGLAQLIESSLDYEVDIQLAYSAFEALNIFNRIKIDIVLSDIRMPGMSGLALQQEINRVWPHALVIFLTGHDDFNYLHTASRNNSFNYILKTEDDNIIVETIHNAVQMLENKFEREQLVMQANAYMLEALPMLQKEWLGDLLRGEDKDAGKLDERMTELKIPLNAAFPVLLMLGRVENRELKSQDQTMLGFSLHAIVNELLSPSLQMFSCMYEHGNWIWLIQPKLAPEHHDPPFNLDSSWKLATMLISQSLEQIQAACKKYLGLKVSLLAGTIPVPFHESSQSFSRLKRIFNFEYGLHKEVLLLESQLSLSTERESDTSFQSLTGMIRRLETYLETSQREPFFLLFSELVRSTEEHANDQIKLQTYYAIVPIFFTFLNKSLDKSSIGLNIELGKLTQLTAHSSWEDAMEYLAKVAEAIFEYSQSNVAEIELKVIATIKRYIENNLAGDLSLAKIGEVVGFNPSYLSRLYKQLSGEGLFEYITEVRLNKAKQLLRNPLLKVHEISMELGFESSAYFTKFFKRATNLTPSEYREVHD